MYFSATQPGVQLVAGRCPAVPRRTLEHSLRGRLPLTGGESDDIFNIFNIVSTIVTRGT